MADRSVVVKLRADIAQYQAAMKQAKDSASEFGREVTGTGKTSKADIEQVGRVSLVAGAAVAAGFGKMVMTAADFEKQMSGVQAVSGASAEEMGRLSDAALAAGASTQLAGVTASDAARAEAELVKAGVSVSDVLGGALMGSLTLASAGQIDFADAATIAAQAMNIFDLRGGQVTHVADVLAAAANKSAADVGGLGDSLRQGGLVASQYGMSLEDTVGTLAAFADNALVGSDAGTALKTMLQRLSPISAESAGLMEELGFSAYDLQGNFIGIEGVADELRDSLAGMTQQQRDTTLAQLFGSDAVRGANILYEQGSEGIREYISAVDDQGAAARMAAIQNDNLKGDVEALGGALESALIENGSKGTGALRGLTQGATDAVNAFSSMPSWLQSTAMGLGAVAGGGALVLGVIGTVAPKMVEANKRLKDMGAAGNFLSNNLGKVAGAVGLAGAGFAVFGAWQTMLASARSEAEKWSAGWRGDAMASAEDGLASFTEKLSVVRSEQRRLSDEADSGSAPWDADKRAQLRAGEEELASIGAEMERVGDLAEDLADSFGITGDAALQFVLDQQAAGVDILAEDYEAVSEAMASTFGEMTTGTESSQTLAAGMETLGSEITSVEDQVKAFGESLDALYNQFFGVETAQDAFQTSLNALPGVLFEAAVQGLNLNDVLTSQSDLAIGVRGHMREMVSGASDLIAEWQEQGITGDALNYRVALLSQSFRDQALAAGVPGPVVDHYLGLLAAIPQTASTAINAQDNASPVIANVNRQLDGISGRRVTVTVAGQVLGGDKMFMPQYPAAGGLIQPIYRAEGGWTPRGTDTVPAMLTPGEFVMQKSAVDRFGLGAMEAMNAGRMFTGASSAPMLSGGGSSFVFAPNIAVHATPGTDGRRVGQDIVDVLADWTRSNGPLPASITG